MAMEVSVKCIGETSPRTLYLREKSDILHHSNDRLTITVGGKQWNFNWQNILFYTALPCSLPENKDEESKL